ncbi:MAG: hypothetical protein ACE37I_09065 [Rubinisphaera brasiliensis]|uniref:Uncharacterized protein n=1 Tax=Rubinisphaera brasiliensis (strain ATCC 49424 / DSM 5305 / JCM 21570 / IAM 15109 / NBRC 103401 / IFAM 1448) TaxID=756272 RepID=F0SLB4_RUBBR|nr:hypothetical protein [Rubinisphaera brasiliensis]ADY62020.1 hypothetical protein Plabr_4448 [Rubinisphaera brasiliensis DSM 5305]MBB03028.1 hypothetical protein [Planctomyces sp.]MBR9804022.1 hypothetical protein [bacterium]
MTSPLELTQQTAEHLQQRISALANQLKQTADSLHQGEPADLQHLAGEITEVQTQIESLSQQVQEHPLLAESERYATRATDLIEACGSIQQRQDAIDLLKRLQLVKSYDPRDQDAIRQMVDQATGLLNQLTSGSADERRGAVQAGTAGDSPFRALYEWINRPEDLSDERWLENQQRITDAFGRNVAMAVLRGRAR